MKKQFKLKFVLILLTLLIPFSFFLASNTEIANVNSDSLQISQGSTLIFGTTRSPIHMDPHYSWDTGSNNVIDQVVEQLYQFDISDPNLPIVPWLASAMPTISPDGTEYIIPLKTGIKFQDGTDFDATAVKWAFDRLYYFVNYSGNADLPSPFNVPLPSGVLQTQLVYLYEQANGKRVINRTEVLGTYSVKIVTNEPKGSFVSLLCCEGSGILSPTSTQIQGKELDYLTYDDNDVLIGTGPFTYQDYLTDFQVNFNDNPDYWQGAPHLTDLTFSIFGNLADLSSALLTGAVDLVDSLDTSFIPQFEADPDIEIDMDGNTVTCAWTTFNYDHINLAMRRALSWGFNYSYMIDVICDGEVVRWPTYIPNGIPYANYNLNYPTFDIIEARNYLLNDPGYGATLAAAGIDENSPDSAWTDLADTSPLEYLNFTYNIENLRREGIGNRLAYDARYIGVHIDVFGVPWPDLINMIIGEREKMDMYALGWGPDYLDPENYINPIYSDTSIINGGNFYEPDVQQLMDDGLTETDPVAREPIYQEIQRLMVEEYLPAMTLYTPRNYNAWRVGVKGWIPNPFGRLYFYPVYFELAPPAWNSGDDTIPSEMNIYYTRNPQIIGSIKIYDSSPISNVQLVNMDPPYNGQPDEGFSLSINHYPQDSNNLYWTDVVVMTTSLLSRGEHHLKLIFYDEQGNTAEKSFVVTVYRQLELKLSGSFDYLEKEKIQISIAAYLVDVETGNPIIPTVSLPLTVNITLVNPNGDILGTFEMEHLGLGVYRYVSESTIDDLKNVLTKGIYLIYGYVDFNVVNHYFSVEEDVIQFHIDPPSGTEPNLWSIFMVGSFGGLTILSVTLTFLLLRRRRRNLELK